jgi:hypothetical protein
LVVDDGAACSRAQVLHRVFAIHVAHAVDHGLVHVVVADPSAPPSALGRRRPHPRRPSPLRQTHARAAYTALITDLGARLITAHDTDTDDTSDTDPESPRH